MFRNFELFQYFILENQNQENFKTLKIIKNLKILKNFKI